MTNESGTNEALSTGMNTTRMMTTTLHLTNQPEIRSTATGVASSRAHLTLTYSDVNTEIMFTRAANSVDQFNPDIDRQTQVGRSTTTAAPPHQSPVTMTTSDVDSTSPFTPTTLRPHEIEASSPSPAPARSLTSKLSRTTAGIRGGVAIDRTLPMSDGTLQIES